jgi:drug/metabolite transporter (DMT)-like permease
MIPALFEVFFAMLMAAAGSLLLENPLGLIGTVSTDALLAVLWLGVFGSSLAYLAFFRLLGRWGAQRTSLVAYQLPVWGIILGVLVLNEQVPPSLLTGLVLIIAGIALVNAKRELLASAATGLRARLGRGRSAPEPAPDPAVGPR